MCMLEKQQTINQSMQKILTKSGYSYRCRFGSVLFNDSRKCYIVVAFKIRSKVPFQILLHNSLAITISFIACTS